MAPPTLTVTNFRRSLAAVAMLAVLAASALAQGALQVQPRMGQPLDGLTSAQLARFLAGQAVFNAPLTVPEGLGPIMNHVSCASCHGQPAAGGAGSILVTRFGIAATGSTPFNPLNSLGGSLLQSQTIALGCEETIPASANVIAHRLTNATFGSGLVEAIPDAALLAQATNPPPGVSGIAHLVSALEDPPGSPPHVGRFGWKAQVATVLTFTADAARNEMGLTNRLLPQENAPNGNIALLQQCDTVPDPEDGPDPQGFHRIDRLTDFQRFLAPPPQTPKSGMAGEARFIAIGCAACHLATPYTTGPVAEAALSLKTLKPYSDFLLHDMGVLGDGIVQGQGTEHEMRTPALWGVRTRDPLLHDGRVTGGTFAQNVAAAIQWHDGEGAAARTAFLALPPAAQAQIVAFLDSLGRAEFDWEGNNNVDEFDWFFLVPFVTGPVPATSITADHPAAVADVDRDGDIDLLDFAMFQRAFTGQ